MNERVNIGRNGLPHRRSQIIKSKLIPIANRLKWLIWERDAKLLLDVHDNRYGLYTRGYFVNGPAHRQSDLGK